MISTIVSIFGVIRDLLTLIKFIFQWVSDMKEKEADERAKRRLEAIEEAKKAETDEEIWAAQDKIIKNKPKR